MPTARKTVSTVPQVGIDGRLRARGTIVNLALFPPSDRRPPRVVAMDDDPKAVELLALRIQGLASTGIRAYGGREAIEAARRELPALIALDPMMPEANGFDVSEARVRGFPAFVSARLATPSP